MNFFALSFPFLSLLNLIRFECDTIDSPKTKQQQTKIAFVDHSMNFNVEMKNEKSRQLFSLAGVFFPLLFWFCFWTFSNGFSHTREMQLRTLVNRHTAKQLRSVLVAFLFWNCVASADSLPMTNIPLLRSLRIQCSTCSSKRRTKESNQIIRHMHRIRSSHFESNERNCATVNGTRKTRTKANFINFASFHLL